MLARFNFRRYYMKTTVLHFVMLPIQGVSGIENKSLPSDKNNKSNVLNYIQIIYYILVIGLQLSP